MDPILTTVTRLLMVSDLARFTSHGAGVILPLVTSCLDGLIASGRIDAWNNVGLTGPADDLILSLDVQERRASLSYVRVKIRVRDLKRDTLEVWEVMDL
jgi:hypothetical protein